MGYLYHNPEDYGLTVVAEYDLYEEAYEFDLVVVWRDGDGRLWAAFDSGCSCPVPFEDHTWPTDFTEVHTVEDVKRLIPDATWRDGHRKTAAPFLTTVRAAIRAR